MILDVKVVPQHTGFAFDHLVPQQQRGLAENTEMAFIKVQAKALVPIPKVGSVVTSPRNHKKWFNETFGKVVVTP